jgi:hypothetical protein
MNSFMWIGSFFDLSVEPSGMYFGISVKDVTYLEGPVSVSCGVVSCRVVISSSSLD